MSNRTNRAAFSTFLKRIVNDDRCHYYFQPPENKEIQYPAIVYSRYNIINIHADNSVYAQGTTYQVIVIDSDPDSDIVYKISKISTAKHDRHYTSTSLNHDVFLINFN